MIDRKTWFITGAGRGMGVDFAKAALAAGHNVVATGRNPATVAQAVGESDCLLVVKLDVTSRQEAEAAVTAAVDRFGRLDVLVNNAASFYAGYFEELTPEEMERQLTTSLTGPMNVTRAVLPVMREQRSGHVVTISSSAGFAGFEFGTAYAASKFGVDGWMESLAPEVEPFGTTPRSSTPGSSARSCSRRSRQTMLRRQSRPTLSATPPSASSGRPRTASSRATPPSSRRRC
jgi:NAD(P)-dependent dehydrogenase (short-subunit alcohol dehydrogenase family)